MEGVIGVLVVLFLLGSLIIAIVANLAKIMNYIGEWLIVIIILACIFIPLCPKESSSYKSSSSSSHKSKPAKKSQQTLANKEYLKANDYYDRGEISSAKLHYLDSYDESNSKGDKIRALGGLIVVCDKMGDYSEARDYIYEYRKIKPGCKWLPNWIRKRGSRY